MPDATPLNSRLRREPSRIERFDDAVRRTSLPPGWRWERARDAWIALGPTDDAGSGARVGPSDWRECVRLAWRLVGSPLSSSS